VVTAAVVKTIAHPVTLTDVPALIEKDTLAEVALDTASAPEAALQDGVPRDAIFVNSTQVWDAYVSSASAVPDVISAILVDTALAGPARE